MRITLTIMAALLFVAPVSAEKLWHVEAAGVGAPITNAHRGWLPAHSLEPGWYEAKRPAWWHKAPQLPAGLNPYTLGTYQVDVDPDPEVEQLETRYRVTVDPAVRAQIESIQAQLRSDPGLEWNGSVVVEKAGASTIRTEATETSRLARMLALATERRAYLDIATLAAGAGKQGIADRATARAAAIVPKMAAILNE